MREDALEFDRANSADELLDWVDEKDRVIGRIFRKEAHENPQIIHREIRIILFDNKGRVLLQKRSPKKKVYPGFWAESCQGHVSSGKSYEEAAHEELLEELGFDTDLRLMEKTLIHHEKETHFAVWFLGRYNGEKIKIEPEEVSEIKMADRREFEKLILKNQLIKSSAEMIQKFWTI